MLLRLLAPLALALAVNATASGVQSAQKGAPKTINDSIDQCSIPYEVMYGVASVERHTHRPVGYPYLISFNNRSDVVKLPEKMQQMMIDSRSMDCKKVNKCAELLHKITYFYKITNIDVGPYSINYRFFKYPHEEYFVLEQSYTRACGIIEDIVRNEGWSWSSIGKYHNRANADLYSSYALKVYKRIQRAKQ